MAKKYLLYIHNDSEFDKVKNKSKLVNELLEAHYWNEMLEDKIVSKIKPRYPKWSKDKVVEIENETVGKLTMTVPYESITNGICKVHGTPLDDRKKCLMKGCKYA